MSPRSEVRHGTAHSCAQSVASTGFWAGADGSRRLQTGRVRPWRHPDALTPCHEALQPPLGVRREKNTLCDYRVNPNRPNARSGWRASPRDGFRPAVRRAWLLARTEGFRGLLHGLGRFGVELLHLVYRNERYRLYELRIDEAGPLPIDAPLEQLQLCVVETTEDAHRLAAQGYEDMLLTIPGLERILDSGAVAVCAFLDVALASIDWMAFSEEAKRSIDGFPYKVEFDSGEACTGGAFTVRRFRGRGIATYRLSRQLLYMRNHGYHVCRNAIAVGNVPSQRVVERFGAHFDRVAHYRRMLWWTNWKGTLVK